MFLPRRIHTPSYWSLLCRLSLLCPRPSTLSARPPSLFYLSVGCLHSLCQLLVLSIILWYCNSLLPLCPLLSFAISLPTSSLALLILWVCVHRFNTTKYITTTVAIEQKSRTTVLYKTQPRKTKKNTWRPHEFYNYCSDIPAIRREPCAKSTDPAHVGSPKNMG